MRCDLLVKKSLSAAAVMLSIAMPVRMAAQPPTPAGGNPPPRRQGGFIPGQARAAGDPVQIERGSKLYAITCRGCHGADMRGGDMGGPNLLRSQAALGDKDGEAIVPIINGSLQGSGMPAIPLPPADAKAVAAYVRSVLGTIGSQGKPPSVGKAPDTIIVGNAAEGQSFFAAKCSSCHSATGDLKGIATRIADEKMLQNSWVAGGGGGRMRGGAAAPVSSRRIAMANVTTKTGETVEGRLVRIDDFLVTLELPNGGGSRTFRREGDELKVEVHDPMKAHRDLLTVLSDKDMHDVTAYLVTLK